MRLALYDETLAYYCRSKVRVGRSPGTDFYTASSSGAIFGELITAACVTLLGTADPGKFEFVEIGAETEAGVLAGLTHPFRAVRTIRVGEGHRIAGQCVVFSNELFDAQPFHRYVFRAGAWRELGVMERSGELIETELAELPAVAHLGLPARPGGEPYHFDAPSEASVLAASIAAQPWTGLFLACDYGKSLHELAEATPGGTARAYFRHTQSNELLARPGEQDLTCHVCWDWLEEALRQGGFANPKVESQESFFVRQAGPFIRDLTTAEAAKFSPRKLALMQMLHPAALGQKFQVLHAWR